MKIRVRREKEKEKREKRQMNVKLIIKKEMRMNEMQIKKSV